MAKVEELTIKDASFGMDSKGMNEYIKNIKTTVLEEAAEKLKNSVKDFNEEIEGYWHGEAKDHFKKKIKQDADDLAKKIEDLEEELENAFEAAQKELETYDNHFIIDAGIKM